ncbi:MAG: hypothetical protein M1824_003871 [Vezdaea acicularis]|nr:MAG: hypothetical protein M1824_003871 [Vezdaea acicularis]
MNYPFYYSMARQPSGDAYSPNHSAGFSFSQGGRIRSSNDLGTDVYYGQYTPTRSTAFTPPGSGHPNHSGSVGSNLSSSQDFYDALLTGIQDVPPLPLQGPGESMDDSLTGVGYGQRPPPELFHNMLNTLPDHPTSGMAAPSEIYDHEGVERPYDLHVDQALEPEAKYHAGNLTGHLLGPPAPGFHSNTFQGPWNDQNPQFVDNSSRPSRVLFVDSGPTLEEIHSLSRPLKGSIDMMPRKRPRELSPGEADEEQSKTYKRLKPESPLIEDENLPPCFRCQNMKGKCDNNKPVCEGCKRLLRKWNDFPVSCLDSREQWKVFVESFIPDKYNEHLKVEALKKYFDLNASGWNEDRGPLNVAMSTDFGPPIWIEVHEFRPNGPEFKFQFHWRYNDITGSHENWTEYAAPLAIMAWGPGHKFNDTEQDEYLDRILDMYLEDFPSALFDEGDVKLPMSILQHVCAWYKHLVRENGESKREKDEREVLRFALKNLVMAYMFGRTLSFTESSKREIFEKFGRSPGLPDEDFNSSRMLNRTMKYILDKKHKALMRETLEKVFRLIIGNSKAARASAFCAILCIIMAVEEEQISIVLNVKNKQGREPSKKHNSAFGETDYFRGAMEDKLRKIIAIFNQTYGKGKNSIFHTLGEIRKRQTDDTKLLRTAFELWTTAKCNEPKTRKGKSEKSQKAEDVVKKRREKFCNEGFDFHSIEFFDKLYELCSHHLYYIQRRKRIQKGDEEKFTSLNTGRLVCDFLDQLKFLPSPPPPAPTLNGFDPTLDFYESDFGPGFENRLRQDYGFAL